MILLNKTRIRDLQQPVTEGDKTILRKNAYFQKKNILIDNGH